MYKGQKIIVVLPAYNAAATLTLVVRDLPDLVDEIILVDDASHDATLELARKLGLKVWAHKHNQGYGANQKTCYRLALESGADIIVMLHPDYQYDPKLVKYLVELLGDDYCDLALGTRIRSRREARAGGMPLYKYLGNRFLSFIENLVSGQNLSEWHTGMRAFKRVVLENLNYAYYSDDFLFDTQILFGAVASHYRIGEIPVPVKYFPAASSINFRRSLKYGLGTLREALKYLFTYRRPRG